MSTRVINLDSFKRGDTPVFQFNFSPPTVGWSWAGIVADAALTDVASPTNNTGAGMLRVAQALTVNVDNTATVSFQLTHTESLALAPDTEYNIEVQLKDGGGTNFATAATGLVTVEQDYVI